MCASSVACSRTTNRVRAAGKSADEGSLLDIREVCMSRISGRRTGIH